MSSILGATSKISFTQEKLYLNTKTSKKVINLPQNSHFAPKCACALCKPINSKWQTVYDTQGIGIYEVTN